VFKKIFDAWRMHQVVKMTYHKPNEPESVRHFEPHILAFRNGIWYAKGYEHGTKDVKVYAIQRIGDASFAGDTFVSEAVSEPVVTVSCYGRKDNKLRRERCGRLYGVC